MKESARFGPPLLVLAALAGPASAEEPRVVAIDGHSMRVQIAGQGNTGTAQPVVVFESGAGTGLGVWTRVLNDVAGFARAVSYDRAGIGLSEPDGHPPTPRHVGHKLHRLLAELDLRPPYVLVGHSWGGPLIRMFAASYPQDVAGPCAPRECHDRWLQFRKRWLEELVPEGGGGAVTVVAEAGHEIQTNDPALVVSAIRRVLETARAR